MLVHLFLDNELGVPGAIEFETHLSECQSCAQSLSNYQAMRSVLGSDELYFKPPASLERRVRGAVQAARPVLGQETAKSAAGPRGWVLAAAFAAVLVAATMAVIRFERVGPSPARGEMLAQEILDTHIRSLLPGHLTDVASFDHHTVKPWFDGKLDFSPPVEDLAKDGFALSGGRIDYFQGRAVAALVYRHGNHIINLFLWPSSHALPPTVLVRRGYNMIHWSSDGMTYWAVSDVSSDALNQFVRLLQSPPGATYKPPKP
ncbi:MAG: anti-sigma factor [Acidobacteriota bacterium]|nr:anti-sigma factor [Acidobacteriota bacterium]